MSTLLIRLAAPLQSWGAESKFEERRATMREPTKSGVIGMIAAALGREREEPIDDLSALKFGVRIDQPGYLLRDYHTAKSSKGKVSYVTHRYYLADAVFLVGLEGDDNFLHTLDNALCSPIFPLYLGRRSCPPTGRISLGVHGKPIERALLDTPWQAGEQYQKRVASSSVPHYLTTVIDDSAIGNNRRRDKPTSFSQSHRKHSYRYVADNPIALAITVKNFRSGIIETAHNAFEALGEE